MAQKILVVDDDNDMCLLLNRFLSRHGFEVIGINSGTAAVAWLQKEQPDLILTDFRLDDMTGADLLTKAKELHPRVPVIIITGYSDVKDAVEVMKIGAYDYVTKPLFPDEILLTIKKALAEEPRVHNTGAPAPAAVAKEQPASGNSRAKATPAVGNGEYIFGDSPEFATILQQIDLVAPTNFSVVIYGESGSGKEVIAQQIHRRSNRANKPFIAIDCGALSKELAASELFGHVKGSFTGALADKVGSFELANEGTIFLDEIANLSYDIQVSLLRVIQERKMRRVGSNKDISLDVRILVASNEKLWEAAKKGKFREDLYHRFNEFSIEVPPLRARKTDLMTFARHFLQSTNAELGKNVKGFSPEVENIFLNYVWHGNLRELKNVVKRATLLTAGDYVEAISLPFEITNFHRLRFDDGQSEEASRPQPAIAFPPSQPLPEVRTAETAVADEAVSLGDRMKTEKLDSEYQSILSALKQANFNKSKAAKLLDIDRKTLYNKMRQYKEFNMEDES